MRTIFERSLADLDQVARRAGNLTRSLPLYEHDPCDCDNDCLRLIEPGYERWTHITVGYDEGDADVGIPPGQPMFRADSDGWGDMGEHGAFKYLLCSTQNGGCGKIWQAPPDLEWD